MSDSEKLTAFAKEVLAMRKWQSNYFKISALKRKRLATEDEVRGCAWRSGGFRST